MHFCEKLFKAPAYRLQEWLESRFGQPFTVQYVTHPVSESEDAEALMIQRWDTKKLIRFFAPELTDNASDPFDRLATRVMSRFEKEDFDNYK